MLWPLPALRIVWKSDEASRRIHDRFVSGGLSAAGIEVLRADRFDGSVGFLIFVLEETLRKRAFRALRNVGEGILAIHLLDRPPRSRFEIIYAREPVPRPREYGPEMRLSLCRMEVKRTHRSFAIRPRPNPALELWRSWRSGPIEEVDLAGNSAYQAMVRGAATRFEEIVRARVVAAYWSRREHLIALLCVDRLDRWVRVGFVPELRMREQVPFPIHHVAVGEGGVPLEEFPRLP